MKGVLFTLVALWSATTLAHSLHVFAQYDGQYVTGNAAYSDQTPAAETYVEAHALTATGEETAPFVAGKTDSAGHFSLALLGAKNAEVVVEGEEGHRAKKVADNLSHAPNTQSQSEFELLRNDIQQLKTRIALHDILGGIGYIFGLFGVVAWLRSRKGNR